MRRFSSRYAVALLALRLGAFQPEKPAKPTPKEKAVELLQAAFDAAPGAQPEVAATALLRIGDNLDGIDKKKALDAMKRGFAVALGIPPADDARRERVQALVTTAAAQISLPDAVAMVKQIEAIPGDYDPRQDAITGMVNRILDAKTLDAKQFDEAIDLVDSVGVTGQYPYAAMTAIFEKLAKQDPRRSQVFGAAMSAYALRPAEPFSEFVGKHWKELLHAQAEAAVGAIVSHILSFKSDEPLLETVSTEKGTITLRTRQDVELFDIMHVLRVFDPKRADEILQSHRELKAALDRFPDGRDGMGSVINMTRTTSADQDALQNALKNGQAGAQLGNVIGQVSKLFDFDLPDEVARKNFLKALDLIKAIPDPAQRAEMLSSMASAATDEPDLAKPILADCMEILKDIKDPDATVDAWSNIAQVAHEIKDDKLTGEALDHGLDNAAALFKRDTDPDNPNDALRDEWPSANAYRKVVIGATKAFSVDAEWILARISDPDMALYARIEMAQALLEREHTNWSKSVSTKKK